MKETGLKPGLLFYLRRAEPQREILRILQCLLDIFHQIILILDSNR